jgi:hypothetical protein
MRTVNPDSPAADTLRAARLAGGLTQTEAAALVYATLRTWQQWEGAVRAMHPAWYELFLIKTGQLAAPAPVTGRPGKLDGRSLRNGAD